MNRSTRRMMLLAAVAFLGAGTAACGDPLVVLGDTPGQMRIIAGGADSSGVRVDSIARRARFLTLSSVVFEEENGLTYVADRGSVRQINGVTTPLARIFEVTSAGRMRMIIDGGGCLNTQLCILSPTAMVKRGGSLIIADASGHRVVAVDIASRAVSVIAGTGVLAGAVEGATAASSPIATPSGLALGGDGMLYVSESGGDRVWSIGADGIYRLVAGGGSTEITSTIAALSARLRAPAGLAVAGNTLYIADRGNHSVEAVELTNGQVRRVAGNQTGGFTGDQGPATSANLLDPRDVAVSPNGGTLYIADTGNHRVRAVDLGTGIIRTYAGTSSTAYNGDRLAAGVTALRDPVAVEIAERGFLFVVDQGHHILRRATLDF